MEIKALATAMIGYGLPKDSLERGIEKNPDFIGSDMGSTDSGPYFLGSGDIKDTTLLKKDLELVITAGLKKGIPVLMGSAGTAGTDVQLQKVIDIIKEISREKSLHFKLAAIHSEIDKNYLKEKLKEGKITPLVEEKVGSYNPSLSSSDIDDTEHIVAQLGPEPFIKALKEGAQVVVAGRSCDTSIFAALPMMEGFDRGLNMHMAKVIECASLCARPSSRDAIMGYLREDSVLFESQNPDLKCTAESIAEHSLYERENPYYQVEPGGTLDMTESSYEQYNERIAKVAGSKWIPSPTYMVKLEGARKGGYRSLTMAGVRDPIMISQIDNIVETVLNTVKSILDDYVYGKDYSIRFRIYGKNGVMNKLEIKKEITSHEIFILVDVVGKTPQISKSACTIAKQKLLHCHYKGILATAGNLAYPFSPDTIHTGITYNFNIYHLLELKDPYEVFPIEIINV